MVSTSPQPAPSAGEARLAWLVLWIALAVGLVAVVWTYRDFGPTADESVQAKYGELTLDYFRSGGEDKSCNAFMDLRFYGPLVEALPALFYTPGEPGKYEARHLFLALLALLCIPAVWLYGRRFGDVHVGAFAVLAVATLPRFCGHWFNNSKDVTFAVAVLWLLYSLAATFTGPSVRWRRVVWCGVAMGLALCARPGGFPLFSVFLVGAATTWVLTREPSQRSQRSQRSQPSQSGAPGDSLWAVSWRLLPKLVAVVAIAWPIMVAPWPWAHENPLLHPYRAMREAADFTTTVPVLFDGATINSDRLPRHYVALYILVGTPLTLLGFAALGLLLGVRDQIAAWHTPRSRMIALTQIWFFVPMLLFAVMRPNIYGGMRHFMFVLPALCVFAAYGAAGLLRSVRRPRTRWVAWAALAALLALPVKDVIRLHPYQMAYYNELVGGVAGASEKYWTDYWASSYREAIEWINERARSSPAKSFTVVVAGNPAVLDSIAEYAAANVELVWLRKWPETLAPADFYISIVRNGAEKLFPEAKVVHTIGRDSAVFTVIKQP